MGHQHCCNKRLPGLTAQIAYLPHAPPESLLRTAATEGSLNIRESCSKPIDGSLPLQGKSFWLSSSHLTSRHTVCPLTSPSTLLLCPLILLAVSSIWGRPLLQGMFFSQKSTQVLFFPFLHFLYLFPWKKPTFSLRSSVNTLLNCNLYFLHAGIYHSYSPSWLYCFLHKAYHFLTHNIFFLMFCLSPPNQF